MGYLLLYWTAAFDIFNRDETRLILLVFMNYSSHDSWPEELSLHQNLMGNVLLVLNACFILLIISRH